MIVKLKLTEEHLKLIPFFFVQEFGDNEVGVSREHMYSLGSHLLEDMAVVLGLMDKAVPNTKDDVNGRAFDDETEAHLLGLHDYIVSHLYLIETLVHQFVVNGGLTPGEYKAVDSELIWSKVE